MTRRPGTAPAPAVSNALAILKFLATQQRPVAASRVVEALGLPRSTTYQLLGLLADEGFVIHLRARNLFTLGFTAFEVGAAFGYQQPLTRLGRPILARLVEAVGHTAHLSVLHGKDVLYLLEEKAPNRPPLVTEEGVTLPSHLTASGRVLLAHLPRQQVRALFPNGAAFTTRHGTGPDSTAKLARVLDDVRARGFGFVIDDVTPGVSSHAAGIFDPDGHPIAALAVTYYSTHVDNPGQITTDELLEHLGEAAAELQAQLTGSRARTPAPQAAISG